LEVKWDSISAFIRRHRWKDNIKMNFKYGVDWIHLNQDRDQWNVLLKVVMYLRVRKMLGVF